MITVTKRVALTSVLFLLGACGSSTPGSGGDTNPASTSTTTTGGAYSAACEQFTTCFNRCYCATQDSDACTAKCDQCAGFSTCSEQCYCERQDLAVCAQVCATNLSGSGGSTSGAGGISTSSGGTSVGGGGTTSAGGVSTSTGGVSTVTGGTTSAGGVVGTGGDVAATGGTIGAGGTTAMPQTETYTFTTEQFSVPPGAEVYKCQDFQNPFGKDIDILYSESFMAPGSHHMFAFRGSTYNNNTGLSDCSGLQIAEYIHTAQTPQQIYTYPPGVGRFLAASDGIRLQSHYINTTTSTINAQVSVTVNYVDPSQVQAHAAAIFLNNISGIHVIPGASTISSTAAMPNYGGFMGVPLEVIGAGSHMHKRGVNFVANVVGGPQIYQTTDWDEPVGVAFDPPMELAPGSSIQWACSYQNDTGSTLGFGESAATNEMCIFTAVYYPAPGGMSIIVNQ